MLVSYRWLQDYVDIPWGPQELADRLTMAGLEVEGIEPVAPNLNEVYIGYIKDSYRHPKADNLTICLVDLATLGERKIVCGAPNVAKGQTVPVALPGAELPNGLKIAIATIRDEKSEGMICSQAELGLGEESDGIWVLPGNLTSGTPLIEALELDDVVLDVSIYANRPDCMSMLGIAREVAALTGGQVRVPATEYEVLDTPIGNKTDVDVKEPKLCPRYTASLLEGVKVQESPLWMQFRLKAAGMRPINNVVDITNYVMLETGQPLHAFDLQKLVGERLVIRTAKPGEKLVTLDGEERKLTPEMLVICDTQNPQCIAGVMGGLESEVTPTTTTILLESANFSGINIRRTSRYLGLSSESSARFEKGIDPHGTLFASQRTAHLLQKFANAQVYQGHLDVNFSEQEKKQVSFELKQVERLLGVAVPEEKMKEILDRLEFTVEPGEQGFWNVTIPSHRGDVEIAADLIEEIVRIWGLEKLPSTLPSYDRQGGQSERLDIIDKFREVLVGAGLQEALTYSFGRRDSNDRLLRFNEPMITIQNPISEDLVALRHSLLPGLLTALSMNSNRQRKRVALFEIGATFLGDLPLEKQPREEFVIGLALWGLRNDPHWAISEETYDFYDLKGILEVLLPSTKELEWVQGENPSLHPGRQGAVLYRGNEVAYYGEVHPAVAREFRLSGRVYAAEIYFERFMELFSITPFYNALPRYPSMERDLAVIVDSKIPVGKILTHLKDLGGELLEKVTVFDLYQGKPIPEGKKSVAFSFRFQAHRNLTEKEINKIMDQCLQGLEKEFDAEIR